MPGRKATVEYAHQEVGLEFRLLGPLEVRRDGIPVQLGGPRERAVLAALLLRPNQVTRIGHLVDAIWERPPASPETNLRTYVSGLRRRLGADRIVTRPGGYLAVAHPGELDLSEFDQGAARGHSALKRGAPAEAANLFGPALRLWRDDPLSGETCGPALRAEIEQLTIRRIDTIEGYAQALLATGDAADVVDELTRFVTQYPLREELWALLIQALHRAGRRPEALAAYARARNRLVDEIGVEPGPRLRSLQALVLRDEPPGPEPATPAPAQLPADLTAFTGRSAELLRLTGLLDEAPDTALVAAIDGMAGIGKTALATRFAHTVRHRFPDGQLFLDLHAHTAEVDPIEPAVALDQLLRSLGVPGGQIPADLDGRAALYRSRLADQRVLVILDNAVSERQVSPLLPAGPGSLVIVTSRRRLGGLDNAVPFPLDELPAAEAVALFTEIAGRSRATGPDEVEEIVRLCGGLPLAVRIAAARFRDRPAWTLPQLIARLRDERGRLAELAVGERSVAATFGLSFRQLGTDQQRAFRLLGLVPGADIDLSAVAALLDLSEPSAARLLDDLIDSHMLTEHRAGRFRFHDLLRDFAARSGADLPAVERTEGLTRVLDHYVRTAALAMDELYPFESVSGTRPVVDTSGTRRPADPAGWLDTELSNLLAAASYAGRDHRPSYAVLLARILNRHLRTRARYAEAERLDRQAVAAAAELGDHDGQLHALRGLASALFQTGRNPEAQREFQRSLDLARETGMLAHEGTALRGLGAIHADAGRVDLARTCFSQALDAARRSGDRNGERHAELSLGNLGVLTGDLTSAGNGFRRALEVSAELGDRSGQAEALGSLGVVHRRTGDDDRSLGYYQQELILGRHIGDRNAEIQALHGLGLLHERAGDHKRALRCHHDALDLARAAGARRWEFEVRHGIGRVLTAQRRYAAAFGEHEAALELAGEVGTPNGQARVLQSLGATQLALGRPDLARKHWEEALRIFTELGAPQADEVAASLGELQP